MEIVYKNAFVHPCTTAEEGAGIVFKSALCPAHNKEYEVTPSASPKLPLVASSRRQLLILSERCVKFPPIKKPAILGGLRKAE